MSHDALETQVSAPGAPPLRRPLLFAVAALALLYVAWLLWMTLRSEHAVSATLAPMGRAAGRAGISSGRLALLVDTLGNVVVFVPLGAVVAAFAERRRILVAVLAGAALSGFIELAQRVVPARVSSLDDWLLNVLGAAAGGLAVWLWSSRHR